MAPSYVLLLAFGIGIIAGLRSLTAPAVAATLVDGTVSNSGNLRAWCLRELRLTGLIEGRRTAAAALTTSSSIDRPTAAGQNVRPTTDAS